VNLGSTEQESAGSVGAPPPLDELFGGGLPIAQALQKLRLRLLDLTARNRLLNFKPTASKTLQFVEGRLGVAFPRRGRFDRHRPRCDLHWGRPYGRAAEENTPVFEALQ